MAATLALAAVAVAAHHGNATVSWGTELMRLSSTGPQSTLPAFFFMAGSEEGGGIFKGFYDPPYVGGRGDARPFEAKTSCPEDVFENTSPDLRVNQLPWRLQEDWGCEALSNRTPARVDVVVLENKHLRAAITPQWGGKVWSLFHKGFQRQLFFNNPAHQPWNIGYRKAWSSGGAEWNWAPGKIGHSVFTEAPVWTAQLDTPMGPLVRVWEYDRLNGTVWQVDMLLVGDVMFAHPKVTNPNAHEVPGYWWTCVAMPVEARARVVTPSTLSVNNNACAPWPNAAFVLDNTSFHGPNIDGCAAGDSGRGTCAWQPDLSFLGNIPATNDFFMHIDADKEPFIAHSLSDGFTVVHSHPKSLNGTKFFEWGFSERGEYSQDFLSASQTDVPGCNNDAYDPNCPHIVHEGRYAELQVGPARTQRHTFPLSGGATLEWTEWFKAKPLDAAKMQASDYSVALKEVSDWIASADGMPKPLLDQVDALFAKYADVPPAPSQILSKGLPWGSLQEQLLAKRSGRRQRLAPGCPFPEAVEPNEETTPWLELLEKGTFSEATLAKTPTNFEVSDAWLALLSESAARQPTWLHALMLGTHALEVGNAAHARELFEQSLARKPNPLAARNLATFAPTADAASAHYQHSWALFEQIDSSKDPMAVQLGADLAVEYGGWMLVNKRWEELAAFVMALRQAKAPLTRSYLQKDRLLHAVAALALHSGDYVTALPILRGHCFPTYGSERSTLIQLWHDAQLQKAIAEKGAELTAIERLRLRKRFRCDGDTTSGTLTKACICGPPNLGYKY